jgi:leucyl aminopeptidase
MSISIKDSIQAMQVRTSTISFARIPLSQGMHVVGVQDGGVPTCSSKSDLGMKIQNIMGSTPLKGGKVAFVEKDTILVGLDMKKESAEGVSIFDDDPERAMQMRYAWRCAGGSLWASIMGYGHVVLHVQNLSEENVLDMVYGLAMKMWRFEGYRTSARPLSSVHCQSITVVHEKADLLTQQWGQEKHVVDAVHWAREIANQPGNVIVPSTFVDHIEDLRQEGLDVQILDKKQMQDQGFGALLGVAQGSDYPPYLGIITWKGTEDDRAPVALVGKGVTFDTGGLSIKPSQGMEDMKLDKTGAVVVCATMRALARRKCPVHVVAVVALVENAVSGCAQRPGDIVTSLSGQTIEVLNTDAEGRLILADALTYVQQHFKPRCIVDVATLTGAVRVALGPVYAGVFSNSRTMMKGLHAAGFVSGERIWPLPLGDAYDRSLDCDVADMKNIATSGFGAGSSTAAQFLHRFVDKGIDWAHLDIASVDHLTSDHPLCPRGGSAFGVQLLTRWISDDAKR